MRIYACAAAAAVFLFAFVALAKSGSSDGAEQPWENPEGGSNVVQYVSMQPASRKLTKFCMQDTTHCACVEDLAYHVPSLCSAQQGVG